MASKFRMAAPTTWVALAALAVSASAAAQDVQRVVIEGRAAAGVGGFGAVPLEQSPLQASVIDIQTLLDHGSQLSALTLLSPAISDAYSAVGYWTGLRIRGYEIDLRHNLLRDGLPISGETVLALENKERIEVLEGTSGVQAGVSAPGGLVNLIVKRPERRIRHASIDWRQDGGTTLAVDLADRFGDGRRFGLRLNAVVADLDPQLHHADGSRWLWALAADWQITPDARIEAEAEVSHQSQPSQPGFSLRGSELPDADTVDPALNLNNQPWSLPVVFDGRTASLRWRQRFTDRWQFTAQAQTQRLRTDDRVAFPFGCTDGATYYADRYCPDGRFDLYDYRSEGEHRRVDAADMNLAGGLATGGIDHDLQLGVQATKRSTTLPPLAFNFVGQGRDDGSVTTPPDPTLFGATTTRRERSTELYLRDSMTWRDRWSLWAGLRHSRIDLDGAEASFTTPWLGLAYRFGDRLMAYASWGKGVETAIAPDLPIYANAGRILPPLQSRQAEIGVKQGGRTHSWSIAAFDIARPQAADSLRCDDAGVCALVFAIDGQARHRGLEVSGRWRIGALELGGGAMWLDAERRGSSDAAINGLRPVNVPARSIEAHAAYDFSPGLRAEASLIHEGSRMVLPDNTIEAPAWTRLDIAARWQLRASGVDWTLRAGVDNVLDARAWRETPFQVGHVYLFPLPPRSAKVTLRAAF